MLAYKAKLYGRQFITINSRNKTQTCSHSHYGFIRGTDKTGRLILKDREWMCPQCDKRHLHDGNAAQNVLAKGLAGI